MAVTQTSGQSRIANLQVILENWALRFLLIGLVALILFSAGLGRWAAKFATDNAIIQENANHFFGEIGFAFTIAAFLILTTERSAKRELQSQFSQYMTQIRKEVEEALKRISNVGSIGTFLYEVQSKTDREEIGSKEEIRNVARRVFDEYITGLKVEEGGFVIADRNWALEANRRFYAMLEESAFDGGGLEVKVTHTGSIKIWENEEEGRASLRQQSDFIKKKSAKIIRIFVGTEDGPSDEYKQVMDLMGRYGIQTYYVKREHPERVLDMTWVPVLQLQMTWTIRSGVNVGEIKISSDVSDRGSLESTWNSLMDDIKREGAPDSESSA